MGKGRGIFQSVISAVTTAYADAAHIDRFTNTDILVQEIGRCIAKAHHVTRDDAVVRGQVGNIGRAAVVDAIGPAGKDGQYARRDVGVGRRRGAVETVIARIGAADTDAAHVNGFAGADIFIQEIGGAVRISQLVAEHDAVVRRQGGQRGGGAVVNTFAGIGEHAQRS